MIGHPPPAAVLAAFGADGMAHRLLGGAGTAWRAGGIVVKPDQDPVLAPWTAEVYASLAGPGFRVPRPVPTVEGRWLFDGWAAWTAVDGEPGPVSRWSSLVAAGRAFHAALATVPVPAWIGQRDDRWAVADRYAWDEETVAVAPELADLVGELCAARRPVPAERQLVHGDLAGNVLFGTGEPPAVIDFSPYHRPAGYALAIAAVDVLTWSAAPPEILDDLAGEPDLRQLLIRALLYRTVTESLARDDTASLRMVRDATAPVVELVLHGRRDSIHFTVLLGRLVHRVRTVPGGHTRAVSRLADLDDGRTVFVKAADAGVLTELAVYEAYSDAPFLPRMLSGAREPVPLLVLEALAADGWVREWAPKLVDATSDLLDRIHALPAPAGLPRLDDVANPWDAIAADPHRLLRLDVCTAEWLDAHLDALRDAAGRARIAGDRLIHRDVRAANLWSGDGRLVLADWAAAAAGDPWYDTHLWLVALCAEGGPAPQHRQGPGAAGHAALIAGQQPLLAPARDSNPALFELRRTRLRVALTWAAELLMLDM